MLSEKPLNALLKLRDFLIFRIGGLESFESFAPGDVKAADLDAAIAASFTARDGLRATWAYRALVARNLVLEFIEEQKEVA